MTTFLEPTQPPAAEPETPETPTKKPKKKKPEALQIPKEISSSSGEPSTLVSTANLTQELGATDKQAEAKAVSPVSSKTICYTFYCIYIYLFK